MRWFSGCLCWLCTFATELGGLSPGELHHAGLTAYSNGDVAGALKKLQKAAQLRPNDVEILTSLASIFHEEGKPAKAVKTLRQALQAQPSHAATLYNLGSLLSSSGTKNAEAESCFRRAITMEPLEAEHGLALAQLLERQTGREAEAETAYDLVFKVASDLASPVATAGFGTFLMRQGHRLEEAQAYLQRGVSSALDSGEHGLATTALHALGVSYASVRRREDARLAFLQALSIDPTSTEAIEALGHVSHEMAIEQSAHGSEHHHDQGSKSLERIEDERESEWVKVASELFLHAVSEQPLDVQLRLQAASHFALSERHADAAQVLLEEDLEESLEDQVYADDRRALMGASLVALGQQNRQQEAEALRAKAVDVGVWPSAWQQPSVEWRSGLRAAAWWNEEPEETPQSSVLTCLTTQLHENWQTILAEFLEVTPDRKEQTPTRAQLQTLSPSFADHEGNGWMSVPVFNAIDGQCSTFDEDNTAGQQCDEDSFHGTCSALRSAVQCAEQTGSMLRLLDARFSILFPGSHILPHCGRTNARLVTHLALSVDPETAWLKAGCCKTKYYEEGRSFVFDDSFFHEVDVSSESTVPRVVLVIQVGHPDLGSDLGRNDLARGA